MTSPRFDPTPCLGQDEGQHVDRKSLFEGQDRAKRTRDRRAVCDQVAEYVAAFANAEGGVLMLGIEDDGNVTGHPLPSKAPQSLLSTPRTRLQPPQCRTPADVPIPSSGNVPTAGSTTPPPTAFIAYDSTTESSW